MKKLLVDGLTTKIACPAGSFRVLVHPSGVDVSHLYPALPVRLLANPPTEVLHLCTMVRVHPERVDDHDLVKVCA